MIVIIFSTILANGDNENDVIVTALILDTDISRIFSFYWHGYTGSYPSDEDYIDSILFENVLFRSSFTNNPNAKLI